MGRIDCTSTENKLRVDLGATEDGEPRNWGDGRRVIEETTVMRRI
jgi:hypothetical protein